MKTAPRLLPEAPDFYSNLPAREEQTDAGSSVREGINHLNEQFLEISRASSLPRGWFLAMGLMMAAFVIFAVWGTYAILTGPFPEPIGWLSFVILPPFACLAIHPLRLDLTAPLDTPVRFNRKTRKVYASSYVWTWNPFGRWTSKVDIYDWDRLEAEILQRTSFNGEVLQTRYILSLAECRPGTKEVIARFDLESGRQTTKELEDLWGFLRRYMKDGPVIETGMRADDSQAGIINCLFQYAPWFAPTAYGRHTRQRMHAGEWFVAFLFSLLLPLWLILGVFYLIVSRLAPAAVWPPEIEVESRL